MRHVWFDIGGSQIEYTVEGESIYGSGQVLFAEGDNLIAETDWAHTGFTIQKFLPEGQCAAIRAGLEEQLLGIMEQFTRLEPGKFSLGKYHEFVNDELHCKVTGELRKGSRVETFPIGITAIEKRVSEICGVQVSAICPSMGWGGYFIRIVRPNTKNDNNPPHRDVWLEHLRNCVNIYFPIAGSNQNSALPIMPGSHLWRESEIERTATGAKVDGTGYQVPAVVGAKRPMKLVRPNPLNNEVMVFTPYAIHGGGINLNPDTTRMSLEIRFWRKSTK